MMKCKTVSKPERISLWPAISFIHFFLLNWKKRFSTKFIFNQKPVRRSCVRLNARRSRDRLGNCSMISCQTPAYTHFSIKMSEYFFPLLWVTCFSTRETWGCLLGIHETKVATWVETLYEAVVRPLVADVECCSNWAAVRVLPTRMEDFLRCEELDHIALLEILTWNIRSLAAQLLVGRLLSI